jgi:hypothetical protein
MSSAPPCARGVSVAALLLLVTSGGSAGPPHVRLEAPAAGAPAAERVAAYAELRRLDASETVVVDGRGDVVESSGDFLALGSGQVVTHAEDLLPVVPPESATAKAAARARHLDDAARPYQVAGLVVGVAGLALGGYSLANDDGAALPLLGLGLVFAGTGIAAVPTIRADQQAEAERISAFEHYDADLRRRLDLCVSGLDVVACGAAAGAAAK